MFIVTKKIDSENIGKVCRTCLREDSDKMVYLFVGPAGSSLAAKLRSLSCLEVWQGDGLPEKMCDRCVTRAESALLYREQCRAADRALRQAALKVAGVTSFTTVSGCKLFQEDQRLVSLQSRQKTLKCIECGAVFMNYQELLAHNKLHLPFCEESLLEPRLAYPNLLQTDPSTYQLVRPASRPDSPSGDKSSCALHCSFLSHACPNKISTSNPNYSSTNEQTDGSCDEEPIEITDSNLFPRNDQLGSSDPYNQVIQDLRLSGSSTQKTQPELEEDQIQVLEPRVASDFASDPKSDAKSDDSQKASVKSSLESSFSKASDLGKLDPKLDSKPRKVDRDRSYSCEQCTRSFSQKSKLRSHVLTHNEVKPFSCSKCEKAYTSKSKLNAHMRLHSGTNLSQCLVCDKEFPYPSYLKEHSRVHESKPETDGGSRTFECSVCKKGFQVEKNLRTHQKLHSGKDLLSCEICDKKFSRKYSLQDHLRMHQSTKLHECSFCEKRFSQRSNLVEHLRVHTKSKPFACEICGKCFAQSSHLKSHKASHESVRSHQCGVCGKRFKLASHLKRHMNLHGGSRVYKCEQCDQVFSHAFSLKRHSKRHGEGL